MNNTKGIRMSINIVFILWHDPSCVKEHKEGQPLLDSANHKESITMNNKIIVRTRSDQFSQRLLLAERFRYGIVVSYGSYKRLRQRYV